MHAERRTAAVLLAVLYAVSGALCLFAAAWPMRPDTPVHVLWGLGDSDWRFYVGESHEVFGRAKHSAIERPETNGTPSTQLFQDTLRRMAVSSVLKRA